jgi:CubicO group peptidase (beta-lactamase class C family)
LPTIGGYMSKYTLIFLLLATLTANVPAQNFAGVDTIVAQAIANQVFPGAVLVVGDSTGIIFQKSYGQFTYDDASTSVTGNTMYDLASLTKVMCVTMTTMWLHDRGRINIEDHVWQYLPEFAQNGKETVKIRHLLLHNSGLPISYGNVQGKPREQIISEILALAPAYPLGETHYSDLSMIVLGELISALTDTLFHEFYADKWTTPLAMSSTMYTPDDSLDYRIAPTLPTIDPGVVHDPLARSLDGISGNAGLFSSVNDLAKMAALLVNEGKYQGDNYLQAETVQYFRTRYDPAGSTRALGWDCSPTWMGTLRSSRAFGHTGYTGTSIMVDPERKLFVVLLTNRVWPDDNASITPTRVLLHDAVIRGVEGLLPQPRLKSARTNSSGEVLLSWTADVASYPVEGFRVQARSAAGWETIAELASGERNYTVTGSSGNFTGYRVRTFDSELESAPSSSFYARGNSKQALIVNDFEVQNGWPYTWHDFAADFIPAFGDSVNFEMITSDLIATNVVNARDYNEVYWICGDTRPEQGALLFDEYYRLSEFLFFGGKLFISGSHIASDLNSTGPGQQFLQNYFFSTVSGAQTIVTVSGASIFSGLPGFQTAAAEHYPVVDADVLTVSTPGTVAAEFGDGSPAGVLFNGKYNGAISPAHLVYFTFPFETISDSTLRAEIMQQVRGFFSGLVSGLSAQPDRSPNEFRLHPAYPNPFNAVTRIRFDLAKSGPVTLDIFDARGSRVARMVNNQLPAGNHALDWDAANHASGIYLIRVDNGRQQHIHKVILLK